jgi:hypothetical protein
MNLPRSSVFGFQILLPLALPLTTLATTTNLLSLTTFQYPHGSPQNSWAYHYASPITPPGSSEGFTPYWYDQVNDPEITNYLGQFTFDDSVFKDFMATNAGASFGVGFGGTLNLTNDGAAFTSTNRADYLYSFDLRVEGLRPGVTSANGEIQLQFQAEDNTLQPQDGNTDPDVLLQVNISLTARSNWTHYAFALNQGSVGGGSESLFALHHTSVNNLLFGCNWHLPGTAFGYDTNNVMYIDNLKVELISR